MKIELLDDSKVDIDELVECCSGAQLILLEYLVGKKLYNMENSVSGLDLANMKHKILMEYRK